MPISPNEPEEMSASPRRIAIVGPCAAGKSTLARALKDAGYDARQPAQEHSYVPYMWQRLTQADVLIYLDVDYVNAIRRSPPVDGGPQRLVEQHQRLAHAFQHCDFYLDTSGLTPDQVKMRVLTFLSQ
jgi:chloramphenicol 3-O-phosphotransferase